MTLVYQPLSDGMYKRVSVKDPAPYLADGWFRSIGDHKASLEPVVEVVKPKRKKKKVDE